jgi:NADH dehydrogenase [ubiquinone] 1 alpha subcomplex assembly factor 7
MQFCLGHPTQGYYTRARATTEGDGTSVLDHVGTTDVFGRKGDFITSPEISQMFGEVRPPFFPVLCVCADGLG